MSKKLININGTDYGTVGKETNLKDVKGNKLHVGDVVSWNSSKYCMSGESFIVERSNTLIYPYNNYFFVMGWEQDWNSRKTDDSLSVELVKGFSEVNAGEKLEYIEVFEEKE